MYQPYISVQIDADAVRRVCALESSSIFTPRVRFCPSVVYVATRIARCRDLSTCKHNEIIKKLALLWFESFGKAREHRKTAFLLGTPINRTPLCFLLMRTT